MADSIETERQALVFIAEHLNDLVSSITTSGVISAALSIQAGAAVNEGASSYRKGQVGSLSLSTQGRLRVQPVEELVDWAVDDPWASSAWEGGSAWTG